MVDMAELMKRPYRSQAAMEAQKQKREAHRKRLDEHFAKAKEKAHVVVESRTLEVPSFLSAIVEDSVEGIPDTNSEGAGAGS